MKIHQLAILPNGKIIVSGLARNFFGDFRSFIVTLRLNNDGSRDYSFNECKLNFGDSYPVMNSIAVEENGNLLLALANQDFGNIDPYNGILMRVNDHGEILKQQNTFWINSMIVQQNKKVMILGFDNPEWGIIKRKVIRMNPDLTVDSTFKLFDEKAYADPYECAVQCVSVQIDNKLVIGGNFYEINGLIANNIARLNPDGSFDYTFNQRRGCNGSILTIAKQANNCLLIGGEFSRYNYQFVSNIARLKKNGELDFSFFTGKGTNGKVYSIAVQADGKILIGGSFTSYNGNSCNNIARLNADGSFDPSFKDVKTDDIVRKIRIDEEGRILIGGDFNTVNNQPHIGVARVQTDGTLDESFHPFIDYTGCVYDCKIAYNGAIYLALNYKNTFDSWIDSKIERLHSDGTIDSTFKIPEALLSKINAIELTDDNHLFAAGMGYYAEPWFYPPSGIIVKLSEEGSRDSVFHYKQLQNFLN
ncbi:MAG TPA: delta-60 repeat domain-containing protein, partial [Bacteroidia bacterium]|nr:delta-60 repeat domain-containing protein [Bacteroidia bacterium]